MAGERFELERTVQALLRDLGISPVSVLRRASLASDLFARSTRELSVEEYYRFWTAVEVEGGDRPLSVEIGRALSVEMFSPSIFAALCSPDLGTAARRVATYKALIGPLRLTVDSTAGLDITFVWPHRGGSEPPPLLATIELLFWVSLARIATREPVRPARVSIPGEASGRHELEEYLGTRVRSGERYSISFGAADASRRFLTENEHMWRVFAPDLRRRLFDLDASASVADRVRAALHETLPAGDASIGAVTEHLSTSPRTLQRQLSAEGATFQGVLTSTREDLARHYLSAQGLRTTEVAYLLGYEDTNSFYRAFRSWTGLTPDAARAEGRNARALVP